MTSNACAPWHRGLRTLWRAAALLLALASGGGAVGQAVEPQRESAVKADFLLKFGSYVQWPAGLFKQPDEALVIGVSGDDEVAADLEQLAAGKNVEGRPVVARRVTDNGSLKGVHGQRAPGRLRDAIAAAPHPALVVTQQENALQLGSVINFSVENGRVRFAVSLPAAETRGIKLSSRLLAVAQSVERRSR
jgi:hypothetical protein